MNKYVFKLYDKQGKLKQRESCENVVVNRFCRSKDLQLMTIGAYSSYSLGLALGTGTGIPAVTDSSMFVLGPTAFSPDSCTPTYVDRTHTTTKFVYTFPATSAYVGTFTEFGCFIYDPTTEKVYTGIITHGLILDAEGNPINIVKTDLDILVVEVYIHISAALGTNMPTNFVPSYLQWPHKQGLLVTTETRGPLYGIDKENYFRFTYVINPFQVPLSSGSGPYTAAGSSDNIQGMSMTLSGAKFLNASGATARISNLSYNGEYYNGLSFKNIGVVPLPNTNFFPIYTLAGKSVGTGDGIKTAFTCPYQYFMKDTDKLYVDGVLQIRGTDYTIDSNNHIGRHPAFSVMNNILANYIYDVVGSGSAPFAPYVVASNMPATSLNHPLICDIGYVADINTILWPGTNGTYNYGMVFSTSVDGVTYTPLETVATYTTTLAGKVTTYSLFQARYLKFAATTTNVYTPYSSSGWIGYVGTGIVFTTPPAVGTVITLDVDEDILVKTSDVVVDVTSVSYTVECIGGA